MDFEKNVPTWEAPGTEPPEELKKSGFVGGYQPPASIFNWFWSGVSACLKELREKLSGHAADKENPHGVTAAQVGLDQVDNTPDTEKYVHYAQESGKAGQVTNTLIVRLNGGRTESSDQFTFDGSTGRTVNITPDKIGAAKVDLSNVDAAVLKAAVEAAGVSGSGGIYTVNAASTDGKTYTASVDGVESLYNGLTVIMIPSMNSTTNEITFNLNGLGAKSVGLPVSANTYMYEAPASQSYYRQNHPITLQYDAALNNTGVWLVLGKQKTYASDLTGTVPLTSGGTGAVSAAAARVNLGAVAKGGDTMTGALVADSVSVKNIALPQMRNIWSGTADISEVENSLNEGDIYLRFKE